jgi:hypothetical protein
MTLWDYVHAHPAAGEALFIVGSCLAFFWILAYASRGKG